MRVSRKPLGAEIRRWTGPGGETSMDDLLAWGCPVKWVHGSHDKIMLTADGKNAVVPEGHWIVLLDSGEWGTMADNLRQEFWDTAADAAPEATPFPRMQHFTVRRVGFRKQEGTRHFVWRDGYAGLTRAELDEGGWTPVYVITEGGTGDDRAGEGGTDL